MSARATRREKLQAAADFVAESKRAGKAPMAIIGGLLARHAGVLRVGTDNTNALRVAGTNATCTWSKDEGLLDAWVRLATLHLVKLDGRSE